MTKSFETYTEFDYMIKILDDNELWVSVPNKECALYIDNLIDDFIACQISREYQSRYNAYVKYNYEPFTTEGFNIETTYKIINTNKNNINFVYYLIDKYIQLVAGLDRMYMDKSFTDKKHTRVKNDTKVYAKNNTFVLYKNNPTEGCI